jgi:hypothetical protein
MVIIIIIIIAIIIITIILISITFTHGTYKYVPETNHVSRSLLFKRWYAKKFRN